MMNGVVVSGEKIRAARKKARLSQNQLAVRCGVQRETVSAWEKDGTKMIQYKNFDPIIAALKVEPESLFGDAAQLKPGRGRHGKTEKIPLPKAIADELRDRAGDTPLPDFIEKMLMKERRGRTLKVKGSRARVAEAGQVPAHATAGKRQAATAAH